MQQQQAKPLMTIHEQRRKALKQKEDTLQTVLTTAQTNPKFIKLLIYSLNSLEGFVSPPNREIRVNANIVIRLEGVEILRMITIANVSNEQIITQAGSILWKLISIFDIVDQDLAKLFADKDGHKAVIEILVTKDKSVGNSVPYIRILNGLVQIPQLVAKLLESGLAETVKKINDLFPDDLDIVSLNFDTMKKISNQKAGRELIIKKDLVKSILDNIMQCAKARNAKGVLSGLTIIDNLSRNENGKEAIINANGIECISSILDMYEHDDRILKKCAKIYSKIAKTDDMKQQLELLRKYYGELVKNNQCENFKDITKALVLISNFMLVEEIGQTLMETSNLQLLCDVFNFISKLNLDGKTNEYIEAYVLLNKYFMVIFKRLFQSKPEIGDFHKDLLPAIENSFVKNWESVKKIVEGSNADEGFMKSFLNVFRQYFCSYNDIIYQCHRKISDDVSKDDKNYIAMLLYIIQNVVVNGKKFFDVDLEANFVASRLLNCAIEISKQKKDSSRDQELTKAVESVYDYLLNLFSISENNDTLCNTLDVIYYLISQQEFQKKNIETLIPVIVQFMNTKQKHRYPNLICMRILDFFLTPEFIEIYLKKPNPNNFPTHGLNYVNCIVSVMTKRFYQTSTVLKVFSSAKHDPTEEPFDFYSNETIESDIALLGTELLKRLIDLMELKKILKSFKEISSNFNPQDSNSDGILSLESSLLTLYSITGIKEYYDYGVNEILESLKTLIQKEITFIEGFKRDKANEKNPNYKEIISGVSKRLKIELELAKMIYTLSVQKENFPVILLAQEILNNVLMKSNDIKNLNNVVDYIKSHALFISRKEKELKPKAKGNDSFIDKLCETFINLLRRLIEEEEVVESVLKALNEYLELKKETCNYLVKGGCPRLLLQVMETTSRASLAHQALKLLKLITMSNEQNLTMIASQNTLLKLFELRAKFVNEERITADCDLISNEILKLPGQEKYASEVLLEAISEFNANATGDYNSNETKSKLLNSLEIINAFSSNKKQVEFLMINNQFYKNLNEISSKTIADSEVSQISEKLMTNEIAVYKKLKENVDDFDQNIMVSKLIDIILKKSNFSDIFISSAKLFSAYLRDEDSYGKYLNGKITNSFIDHLFEINDNYLDDPKVSKEINNILCYLCLRNDKYADYIKTKGGLANVLEELKMNLSINDSASQLLKLNSLKMLDTLCRDDKSMELFVKANGVGLIHNIIKNELTLYPRIKDREVYMTNEPISTNEKIEKAKQETYFSYCIKIVKNGIEKGYKEFLDEKQMKSIVLILNAQYPNSELYQEIASICLNESIPLKLPEKYMILLVKCALSIEARYTTSQAIFSTTEKLLTKMGEKITSSKEYIEGLKKEIQQCLASNSLDQLNNLATYLSLVIQMPGYANVFKEAKGEIVDLFKKLVNVYGDKNASVNEYLSDGVVISLMLLVNYLAKNAKSEVDLKEHTSKLLLMGIHYYNPSNSVFALEFIKEFDQLFTLAGKEVSKEPSVKYSDDYLLFAHHIYFKSFEYLDKMHSTLKESRNYHSINKIDKEIIDRTLEAIKSYLLTSDENEDKSRSITKLFTVILNLIDNFIDISDTMEKEEFKKHLDKLWNIINVIFHQEYSKAIIDNIDLLKTLFKLLSKSKKKSYYNASFNEILNEISKNVENSTDVFEKIVKQIEEELTASPKQNLSINLETLANLSKYSSAGKVILKSSSLWKELNSLYSTDTNLVHRRLIATIYSNVMKNSYSLDLILSTEPETFQHIGQKISLKENILKEEKYWDIATMEVDTIYLILQDQNNYQQITQKKLITNDDLQAGIDNYKGVNDEISQKLGRLKKKIEEHHQHEKEETNYKYDIEILSKLIVQIEIAFDEHMNILGSAEDNNEQKTTKEKTSKELGIKKQQSKVVQSGTVLQTTSTVNQSRLSLISRTLFFNEKNGTINSPLSTRNSQDMSAYLDSVLALIRLMYNSNKTSQDQEMKVKREQLIVKGLRLIKLMSICEDNHKGILELGLINFMERLVLDNITNKSIYIASLDILKNCTWSESAVLVLLESPLLDQLIEEVLDLYTHPEKLVNNDELCSIFLYENMNFSNLCKSKKGFEEVFKKIGLDKLRQLGAVTGNVVVLTSIIEMILNYLQNNEGIELTEEFLADVIKICEKGLNIAEKTPGLVARTVRLIGMIYMANGAENIRNLNVVSVLQKEFSNYKCEPDFLLDIIYTLAIICLNNERASSDCVDLGLLKSIVDEVMNNSDQNDNLIEKLSLLFRSLVSNNSSNCAKLCQDEIINCIMTLIERYSIRCKQANASSKNLATLGDKIQSEKERQPGNHLIENRILINLIYTLDSLTGIQISVDYLAKSSSFLKTLVNTIDRAISDVEIVKISLHSIGNYFYKETKKDWKHFEIEQLYTILKNLQKQYYANSEVLTSINHISGYILKGFDSMLYTTKYYGLIMESLNCQDWNLPLVTLAFTLIKESLIKHPDLIVESFDETKQQSFNILRLYFNNSEVQIKAYDILKIYSNSAIYSFFIVNSGIMPIILDTIDNEDFNSNDTVRVEIRASVMNLLCMLGTDEGNAKMIANTLLEKLVREIGGDYSDDIVSIVRLFATLLKHKKLVEPFIQFNGLTAITKLLTTNPTKTPLVLNCFRVVGNIAYAGDEYRKLLQDNQFNELIADLLTKAKDIAKIVFEAKALIHLVNLVRGQKSGKEYKEIDMDEIRIEKLMKNQVKAFLTSGRTVKIYTVKGKVKEKCLVFSQDLLKVMCKKLKTNIPPKPKWVIETLQIQKIVKGHGTDLFKKSKTLFRSLPKPEKCFSIIGPVTIDGVKSFNAECETEDEVNLWIKYLEIAFNYLTKYRGEE